MSINCNPKMTSGIRPVVYFAFFSVILIGIACGLPFGGNPTPRAQEAIATPTLPPLPTATPEPLPPGLVESDPPIHAEMPLDGPITLFFNQPMDRESVEAALKSQMQQKLSFTWVDDSTVVVYLTEQLSPETALAFKLDTDIRSRDGMSLMQPISLNFQTAGYLRVVQFLPENNAQDIDPTSAVMVSFNRPVVPLGADPASLPAGFSIAPTSQGQGEWLNTSTYIFYPKPALDAGTTYTVQVNPDLKSTDGSPLDQTVDWSFSTALPELLSVDPSTETSWRLDPKVIMTFNQPMLRSSVESHFSMLLPDGRPVAGKFSWEEDDTRMIFTPDDLLPRATSINLVLDAQAQAIGGAPLAKTFSALVVTVPELSVSSTVPAEGGEIETRGNVALTFTSLLSENQDLKPYIQLEPAVADFQPSVFSYTLTLYGTFAANTNYQLIISPDLADIWGGRLGQEFQLSFRTNPLPPNISILTGADAIFLTPQDLSLVVQAVNVSQVPLTVGSVPLTDLFTLMGPNGYEQRQNYQSSDQASFTQPLDLEPDEMEKVQLYLTPDQKALRPGIYFVRLNFPQDTSDGTSIFPGPYLVVVSNIQLTFKLSATDALVWAVDTRDGKPLPNAPLVLYDENGQSIASGQTDSEGIFRATFPVRPDPYSPVYAVLGQPDQEQFGMAISSWSSGIEPWDFDISFNPQPPGLFLYLYTDRPIYRPGDTVYFRAITRQAFNGRYSPADLSSLPITIYGAEGRELMDVDLPLSGYGTANGEFDLPKDAQPGYYSITSTAAPNTYFGFQVASYRKPEINLEVSFSEKQALAGERLSAEVNARYFFDAPAGNIPLHWALYSAQDTFNLSGYQVGPEDTNWLNAFRIPNFSPQLGTLIEEGDAQTSADGLLSLDFPTKKKILSCVIRWR